MKVAAFVTVDVGEELPASGHRGLGLQTGDGVAPAQQPAPPPHHPVTRLVLQQEDQLGWDIAVCDDPRFVSLALAWLVSRDFPSVGGGTNVAMEEIIDILRVEEPAEVGEEETNQDERDGG